MKKLTLGKTWTLCLRMWKWIAEQIKENPTLPVNNLKWQWLERNGFNPLEIFERCFFCQYAILHNGCMNCDCPGKLVDMKFSCIDTRYDYEDEPIKFYQKLLSLNRKRLLKKRTKK